MKLLLIALAVLLGVGAANAETLVDWVARQNTRDLVALRRRANGQDERTGRRLVASITPQTPIEVDRDAWDKERRTVARVIMQQAGITVQDLPDARAVYDKITAWIAVLDTGGKINALVMLPIFWAAYGDLRSGNWTTEADDTVTIQRPGIVTYQDSPASRNGWGSVTMEMIVQALRNQAQSARIALPVAR